MLVQPLWVLPQRSLQDGEEARELRHNQTLDAAVFISQPQQVSHQRLHLRRHKQTLSIEKLNRPKAVAGVQASITVRLLKKTF